MALKTQEEIVAVQETLKLIIQKQSQWPRLISNGTVMVVEKFFDSQISLIPAHPSAIEAYTYKILHGPDFALVTYSAKHCFEFIKGFQQLQQLFTGEQIRLQKNSLKLLPEPTELKTLPMRKSWNWRILYAMATSITCLIWWCFMHR
jgi:hypothetical protein